jgi:ATP-binding cassette subfamily C (CFTR/MRP) protein 4
MDDPISALDARVRRKVFMNCLQGVLKDKTRILITHSIDFLSLSDRIIIMDEGKIYACGTFDELKSDSKMKKLLEINAINKKKELTKTDSVV